MKIAIIGAGNIGSWMAKRLREKNEVAVYDKISERARKISGVSHLRSLIDLVQFQPELLLNAVTIQNTVSAFNSSKKFLSDNCILADVTSVKGNLGEYY
ncbi:MAG: NAD(P)-binding domain-containing protein, partial [Candidatus Aminicenantales bacterium]